MSGLDHVQVPKADAARDALHALRGYAYQLYATALEWARLPPDAELHVERGSDYMAVAADALRGVEVKSTEGSGPVTLRGAGVVTLLSRFWRLARENAQRQTQMVYFTTSPAGVEQGAPFGAGVAGLDYWRQAAAGADVTPLRTLLLTLKLDDDLARWLTDAPDDEVRAQLLKPIQFACGQPRLDEITGLVETAFVDVGARLDLLPDDCVDAVPAAVLHLLRLAAQAQDRIVTRGDLHEILQRHGSSRVSNALLQQLQQGLPVTAPPDPGAIDVCDMPTDDLVVARDDLLADLDQGLAGHGLLWLTGASGLGKTGLALQLAARRNGRWWVVEFDPNASSVVVAQQLRRAQRLTLEAAFGGIILDDMPRGLDAKAILALRRLAAAARRADGALVVTAYNPPDPDLADALCPDAEAEARIVREAPYFSESEVGAFVAAAGGDPAVWALPTQLYAGGGYPKFVAARVSDLKRRGWPAAESDPSQASPPLSANLEVAQAALLDRLMRELPANAKTLLYRLAVPNLGFDKPLALAIGAIAPAIEAPGEALNILVGPWVERREAGRLRVSPLVARAGAEALGPDALLAVHRVVAGELSTRRPLEARNFDQLSLSALIARHVPALNVLAGAVMQAGRENQGVLSTRLFVLMGLRLDRLILPEDPHTALLLRTAQLKLCAQAGQPAHTEKVYRRLVEEAGTHADATWARAFHHTAMLTVLMQQKTAMPPSEWFAVLRELGQMAGQDVPAPEMEGLAVDGANQDQLMFLWRTSHLASVEELEGVFDVLDSLPPAERAHYLAIFATPAIGLRSLIQPAWVGRSREADFQAREVAERYGRLQAIAERWNQDDLAVECLCSQVVLLAEYAHDESAALVLLDTGEQTFPGHNRLRRERAKILGRGEPSAALGVLLQTLLDATPTSDIIERFHLLREIAVNVGLLGDLDTAARRLEEAAATAERAATLRAMAAALLADLAVVQVRQSRALDAAQSLFRAARLAETARPEELDIQFRLRGLMGVATWVWVGLNGFPQAEPRLGAVSGPVSRDPLPGAAATPLLIWHQLRQIERTLKVDLGAKPRLDAHRAEGVSPYFEALEVRADLDAAIDAGDLDAFFPAMTELCRNNAWRKATGADAETRISQLTTQTPWAAFAFDLSESAQLFTGRSAVAALVMRLAASKRWETFDALAARLAADPALAPMINLANRAAPVPDALLRMETSLAPSLEILFGPEPATDPQWLLASSLRVWTWIKVSAFVDLLEGPLGRGVADRWRGQALNGAFALRNPRLNGPAILEAAKTCADLAGFARLILAALPAVDLQLASGDEAALREEAARA